MILVAFVSVVIDLMGFEDLLVVVLRVFALVAGDSVGFGSLLVVVFTVFVLVVDDLVDLDLIVLVFDDLLFGTLEGAGTVEVEIDIAVDETLELLVTMGAVELSQIGRAACTES